VLGLVFGNYHKWFCSFVWSRMTPT